MLRKNDRRAFFARICIIISFIITSVAVPTSAFAATCVLSYDMTPKTGTITSGETITYAVTVKNIGNGMCRDVSYSIFYAENESFVSATPAPRASNYYWYVGNLSSNKRATATVTTRHNASIDGNSVNSEGCAAGRNARDACAATSVTIESSVQPIVVEPITQPVVVAPIATTTTPVAPVTSTTTAPTSPIPTPTVTQPIIQKGKEQGMWVWSFPSQMNTTAGTEQMKAIASQGFNAVYITIDDYLDIAALPEGANKNTQKAAYFLNLNKFIKTAHGLGIAVDVEGGWKDWAYLANRWKGFALIDAAKEYNAAYPNAKIRAFQYDVEPYLLSEYETNKAKVLTEFVEFTDQSVNRLAGSDIKFSMAIPHFYDKNQAWTPTITYGGVTTHTFSHLLRILEKKPGSMILLMSYRDYFEGAGGTKEIALAEIQEASTGGYSTLVLVGQETGNVDPAYVTFYGSTKTVVLNMLGTISSAFGSYSNYGGTATHYIDSFLAMRP
jgi:uncharacterized repeat protein (TIGR01451 family)